MEEQFLTTKQALHVLFEMHRFKSDELTTRYMTIATNVANGHKVTYKQLQDLMGYYDHIEL